MAQRDSILSSEAQPKEWPFLEAFDQHALPAAPVQLAPETHEIDVEDLEAEIIAIEPPKDPAPAAEPGPQEDPRGEPEQVAELARDDAQLMSGQELPSSEPARAQAPNLLDDAPSAAALEDPPAAEAAQPQQSHEEAPAVEPIDVTPDVPVLGGQDALRPAGEGEPGADLATAPSPAVVPEVDPGVPAEQAQHEAREPADLGAQEEPVETLEARQAEDVGEPSHAPEHDAEDAPGDTDARHQAGDDPLPAQQGGEAQAQPPIEASHAADSRAASLSVHTPSSLEEPLMSSQPHDPVEESAANEPITAQEGTIDAASAQAAPAKKLGWLKLPQRPTKAARAAKAGKKAGSVAPAKARVVQAVEDAYDDLSANDGKPPLAFMQPPKPGLVDRLRANPKQTIMVTVAVAAAGAFVVPMLLPHHAPPPPEKTNVTVLSPSSTVLKAAHPAKAAPVAVATTTAAAQDHGQSSAVKPLVAIAPVSAPAPAGSEALAQAKSDVVSASHDTAKALSAQAGPQGLISVQYVVNGRNGVAWVDPARKLVFLGTLLTTDGKNLLDASVAMQEAAKPPAAMASAPAASQPQAQASGPMPPIAGNYQAQAVLTAMEQAVGAHTGMSGEAPIWIFVDPDDPNSAKFFMASTKKELRNKASITWVPVAIQDPHSLSRAAWILNQVGPAYAMKRNFEYFNHNNDQGGAPLPETTPVMVKLILKNTRLLSDTGSLQTPAALFCTADGKPHVMYAPTDLSAILAIAGPCKGVVSNGQQQ